MFDWEPQSTAIGRSAGVRPRLFSSLEAAPERCWPISVAFSSRAGYEEFSIVTCRFMHFDGYDFAFPSVFIRVIQILIVSMIFNCGNVSASATGRWDHRKSKGSLSNQGIKHQ